MSQDLRSSMFVQVKVYLGKFPLKEPLKTLIRFYCYGTSQKPHLRLSLLKEILGTQGSQVTLAQAMSYSLSNLSSKHRK